MFISSPRVMQICVPVITPRKLKSVMAWLNKASMEEKEKFRRVFAAVQRPAESRFLTAPIEDPSRPKTSSHSRPRTSASLHKADASNDDPAASRMEGLRARIMDALPPGGGFAAWAPLVAAAGADGCVDLMLVYEVG
jgi:hypothetical protein